jgi:hypothetical protein
MKKILMIMLLTFTTMATADEGKYTMLSAQQGEVFVLNTENGNIKQCWFSPGKGVVCTSWRKNDEDRFYED